MAAKTCLGCVIPRNKLRIRQLALFSFIVALKLDHFGASESISWSALKRTKTRGPTARQLSYTEKKAFIPVTVSFCYREAPRVSAICLANDSLKFLFQDEYVLGIFIDMTIPVFCIPYSIP